MPNWTSWQTAILSCITEVVTQTITYVVLCHIVSSKVLCCEEALGVLGTTCTSLQLDLQASDHHITVYKWYMCIAVLLCQWQYHVHVSLHLLLKLKK